MLHRNKYGSKVKNQSPKITTAPTPKAPAEGWGRRIPRSYQKTLCSRHSAKPIKNKYPAAPWKKHRYTPNGSSPMCNRISKPNQTAALQRMPTCLPQWSWNTVPTRRYKPVIAYVYSLYAMPRGAWGKRSTAPPVADEAVRSSNEAQSGDLP